MNNSISIGLGEQHVSHDQKDVLVAYGLGSCVAVSMVDPLRGISGMIHCVLPERTNGAELYSPKFVDSGVEGLLQAMIRAGADPRRLIVRMAGGANMLSPSLKGDLFDIGTRNVQSAHRVFERLNLRLAAEQVGGNTGRTVRLYVVDGRMTVRIVGGVEKNL